MYKVNLTIIQKPGGSVMDMLKLQKVGEYDIQIFKMDFTVKDKVKIKANLGFFNNRYINFKNGKKTKGDFYGFIRKSFDGVSITWAGEKPPYDIRHWSFL